MATLRRRAWALLLAAGVAWLLVEALGHVRPGDEQRVVDEVVRRVEAGWRPCRSWPARAGPGG